MTHIGVLTAGGDCPGLNAAIRGVVARAVAGGSRVSGIEDGWVEFHLTRSEESWPNGTYAISVRVAGTVVQSGEVEVEDR